MILSKKEHSKLRERIEEMKRRVRKLEERITEMESITCSIKKPTKTEIQREVCDRRDLEKIMAGLDLMGLKYTIDKSNKSPWEKVVTVYIEEENN